MMNRKDARKIAETITNEQIAFMFGAAKVGIKDWGKISSVNKGMTKGTSWNILTKGFDLKEKYHILAKTNMVREFGDFLPEELKIKKAKKGDYKSPFHQDPIFD